MLDPVSGADLVSLFRAMPVTGAILVASSTADTKEEAIADSLPEHVLVIRKGTGFGDDPTAELSEVGILSHPLTLRSPGTPRSPLPCFHCRLPRILQPALVAEGIGNTRAPLGWHHFRHFRIAIRRYIDDLRREGIVEDIPVGLVFVDLHERRTPVVKYLAALIVSSDAPFGFIAFAFQ